MSNKKFIIIAETSVFVKSISYVVNVASDFKSSIIIAANGREADAKSIINIMALGIGRNSEIEIKATGEDADLAIAKIQEVLKNYQLI